MSHIKLLDCTLRDGGYTNGWRFGQTLIEKTLIALDQANIDVIELGYLRTIEMYDTASVLFPLIENANYLLAKLNITNRDTALMVDQGSYNLDLLPDYVGDGVNVIRLVFHKSDIAQALKSAEKIIAKGYKCSFQPMAITTYSLFEFVNLLSEVKKLSNLWAFYLVDSFGSIYRTQVETLFDVANSVLDIEVVIGWHSHNNLQLSYSHTMALVTSNTTNRKMLIDASVMGIGRGAGNLNLEIIIGALNNQEDRYHVTPVFSVANELKKYDYGYDVPFYITAKLNMHPSYGIYAKEHLKDVDEDRIYHILKAIPEAHKAKFDVKVIETFANHYKETRDK